ncbi:MAG: type IVB secretion system protein IcmH/DotU [Methylococcaceae bacterium]|nr:type IVB secretion system protein IcmH/DotU [Methylococcaceae bacterium]
MNDDDPFATFSDDDRTVIKPSPGGGRRRHSPSIQKTQARQPDPSPPRGDLSAGLSDRISGRNGMLVAAFSLLCFANQLRNTISHRDIEGLHARLVKEIREFERKALQQGFPQDQVRIGRYAMCTFIDETVLNTPWGSEGIWGHKSLLITFHKEAWGGEKFFQYLNGLVRQPATNIDLLELFYYCLSLGFQGKYRIADQGAAKLEQLRENLYLVLQRQAGDIDPELSIRWEGIKDRRNALMRYVPLWVIGSVVAVLLLLIYLSYLFLINRDSDPVFNDLYAIGREAPPREPVRSPTFVETPFQKIRMFLAPEIARHELEVLENNEGTVVRIRGFFGSAQDRVEQQYYPLLQRVAEALETEPGSVLVAGNTDGIPIRTLRFPSNWHLSEGRAKDVARILLASGQLTGRVESEGRADNEPLASNSTEEGRELNRRVDIILK